MDPELADFGFVRFACVVPAQHASTDVSANGRPKTLGVMADDGCREACDVSHEHKNVCAGMTIAGGPTAIGSGHRRARCA
jgi:hypothetical protein